MPLITNNMSAISTVAKHTYIGGKSVVLALFLLLLLLIARDAWTVPITVASLLYYLAIWACGTVALSLSGHYSRLLSSLIFSGFLSYLSAEAISLYSVRLHLNGFLLKTLWNTPDLGVGINWPILFLAAISSIFLISFILHKRLFRIRVHTKTLSAVALLAVITSQLMFMYSYSSGHTSSLRMKRDLTLFTSLHPYHMRIIGQYLGMQGGNSFAIATSNNTEPHASPIAPPASARQYPNILFIIADSWRAKDIASTPDLMPTLKEFSNSAWVSYDHISPSSCTHFGLYSLFSADLPTGFSHARENKDLLPMLQQFQQLGYEFSTSEAESLDWYDTAPSLFGSFAKRHIAPDNLSHTQADAWAVNITLNRLQKSYEKPQFHMLYLYGTHYPYGDEGDQTKPAKTRYLAAQSNLDGTIAPVLQQLRATRDWHSIITADHGETIPDTASGRFGHNHFAVADEHTVPLIISGFSPTGQIRSHMDLLPAILEELGHSQKNTSPQTPLIYAACDYDYPQAFRVMHNGIAYDFIHDDGHIYPMYEDMDTAGTTEAAQRLIHAVIR